MKTSVSACVFTEYQAGEIKESHFHSGRSHWGTLLPILPYTEPLEDIKHAK